MTSRSTIRLSELRYPVTALGPGCRLGLWVQGCRLACPGCMSRHTWDPDGGREIAVDDLVDTWRAALADGADGITVSGGEPLDQPAIGELLRRFAEVRDVVQPESDILLYTGYSEREARRRGADPLAAADAVITGRYLVGRPTRLIWRGSANQRLLALSELGTVRYTPYIHHEPQQAPMQLGLDESGVWLIGVPRAGDLRRLSEAARRRGIGSHGSTWSGEHS